MRSVISPTASRMSFCGSFVHQAKSLRSAGPWDVRYRSSSSVVAVEGVRRGSLHDHLVRSGERPVDRCAVQHHVPDHQVAESTVPGEAVALPQRAETGAGQARRRAEDVMRAGDLRGAESVLLQTPGGFAALLPGTQVRDPGDVLRRSSDYRGAHRVATHDMPGGEGVPHLPVAGGGKSQGQ